MKTGKWELKDLYPGAHIRVKFDHFYHHGIYIGDDEVIQFGLPYDIHNDPTKIKVLKSSLAEFCGNENAFIEVYVFTKKELKEKKKDEEIVLNAINSIGESGYSIIHNNCEHFANRCIFGIAKSSQIDDIYEQVSKMLEKC